MWVCLNATSCIGMVQKFCGVIPTLFDCFWGFHSCLCLPSFLGMEKRGKGEGRGRGRKSRWEEGRGCREEKGRVEIEGKGEGG